MWNRKNQMVQEWPDLDYGGETPQNQYLITFEMKIKIMKPGPGE